MDNSHKTAITRKGLSRPAKLFKPYIEGRTLDFGCGKGTDADLLYADKYDPVYSMTRPRGIYGTVLCIYVLNVIRSPWFTIKEAMSYVAPRGLIMVATRTVAEIRRLAKKNNWKYCGQGYLTGSDTYQRGFTDAEIESLIGWELIKKGGGDFSYVIMRRPEHESHTNKTESET